MKKQASTQRNTEPKDHRRLHEVLVEGMKHQKANRLQEAIVCYRTFLQNSPREVSVLINLGVALRAMDESADAIACLKRALSIDKTNADANYNIANAYRAKGQLDLSVKHYRAALEAKPAYQSAYGNLALVLKDLGRYDEGAACIADGLHQFPDDPKLYLNMGVVLWENGRVEAAIAAYRRSVEIDPDDGQTQHNLAAALFKMGAYDEAIEGERRALELLPELAEAHAIVGQCLVSLGRLDDAMPEFDKALAIEPENLSANLGVSRALLLSGDLKAGLERYEWRFNRPNSNHRDLQRPVWDGSTLNGKRILLTAEQGLGDMIQAIRFTPFVADRGGTVLIECPKPLVRLIRTVEGVDQVVEAGSAMPEFDVYAPLLSLPRILGTTIETIPNKVPYLGPGHTQHLHSGKGDAKSLRVGVVWAGSPSHENDLNRSCPLHHFLHLVEVPRVVLYSLQFGPRANDRLELGCGTLIADATTGIRDFLDSARIVSQLDLVITVDTAVAHLAGALGIPVWVLVPFAPDWRWMLVRTDSPWYPTMTLYRQPAPGAWDRIMFAVIQDLKRFGQVGSGGKSLG